MADIKCRQCKKDLSTAPYWWLNEDSSYSCCAAHALIKPAFVVGDSIVTNHRDFKDFIWNVGRDASGKLVAISDEVDAPQPLGFFLPGVKDG